MVTAFFRDEWRYFWNHYMGGLKGAVPEPEHAYINPKERWSPRSPWYLLREEIGRHRCPACNKPYFFRDSAWNCHPKASAYKIWQEFSHSGPAGARSLSDAIRAEISNPYGAFGNYGGPYGL